MKRKARSAKDFALIGRVFAEVGAGNITRAFVSLPGYDVAGLQGGRHVWINEDVVLVEVIVHECLHRAFPAWSEQYIRRTTSYVKNTLSDEEVQALVDEYRKRVRVRKSPVKA